MPHGAAATTLGGLDLIVLYGMVLGGAITGHFGMSVGDGAGIMAGVVFTLHGDHTMPAGGVRIPTPTVGTTVATTTVTTTGTIAIAKITMAMELARTVITRTGTGIMVVALPTREGAVALSSMTEVIGIPVEAGTNTMGIATTVHPEVHTTAIAATIARLGAHTTATVATTARLEVRTIAVIASMTVHPEVRTAVVKATLHHLGLPQAVPLLGLLTQEADKIK